MMKTVSFYILQLFSMVCRMKLIRYDFFLSFMARQLKMVVV